MKKTIALLLGAAGLALLLIGSSSMNRAQTRIEPEHPPLKLSGDAARRYLEETGEGQSLMGAVTAARFGLEWRQHAPGESTGASGYMGMSHEQDLNAWFDEEGMTVRPTLRDDKRDEAWSMAFRLSAYGYGNEVVAAPPIVSRKVKGNRIEYQRGGQRSEVGGRTAGSPLVEWYENRSAGIEQGFTLNERPSRTNHVSTEELRVVLAVQGDLHAEVKQGGQAIELSGNDGKGALSYSKLVAFDADGKRLAARMEASADGREIALVVVDQEAAYPIVIDPIVTPLEKKLEGFTAQQTDARFGFAVAIEGDRAVVGAWRHDSTNVDVGYVFTFTRAGTSWSLSGIDHGNDFNATNACGWSVAISGNVFAYGCPGANNQAGRAYLRVFGSTAGAATEIIPTTHTPAAGDQFGYSIALSGNRVVVGAPFADSNGADDGEVDFFSFDSNLKILTETRRQSFLPNEQLGTSVAIGGNVTLGGAPNPPGAGTVFVYEDEVLRSALKASDRATGDLFGESVDISGDTAVVGAWGEDDNGTDAGAAYVFVRQSVTTWSQQQKLTASDARPGDNFSIHAVAIEGDTIVVGADAWDLQVDGDNAGAAYVFTRSGTVWTQQAELNGNAADNFGIGVDLSGDTMLIGARAADATGGPSRAGAAYIYRLPHTLANVSTRLRVETGDNVLIGGFIVTGTQAKRVIVRAIGPSLPLADKVADPTLELYQGNTLLYSNDNWVDSVNKQSIINSGVAPTSDLESAIVATLPANNAQYTAIVRGVNGGTGIGVVEAYDLDASVNSKLANISTRGLVQTGDNVLFAGTIVTGAAPQKVIIRALGPSVPVPGRITDPTLELHDSNGALLEANDNWVDSPNKQAIIDSTVPPTNDLESAIVRTLSPANYTAIVRGTGGTVGIAVVEVYALN